MCQKTKARLFDLEEDAGGEDQKVLFLYVVLQMLYLFSSHFIRFILLSRNSRFIKVEDKRINLDDIEERLNKEGIEAICTGDENIKIWHTKKNLEEFQLLILPNIWQSFETKK